MSAAGGHDADKGIRFQEAVQCVACGSEFRDAEIGKDGCCADCRPRMKRRSRVGQHLIASLVTLPFAIWVWQLDKLDVLPRPAWLLPLMAAYYLGFRIGRELVKGYRRWQRSRS